LIILSTFLADTEAGVASCRGGMDEFETRSCPEDIDGCYEFCSEFARQRPLPFLSILLSSTAARS
jgi:hypothetical protein